MTMNEAIILQKHDALKSHDVIQIPEYSLEYLSQYSKEQLLEVALTDILKFIDFMQLLEADYLEIENLGTESEGKNAFEELKQIFQTFQKKLSQYGFMGKFFKIILDETSDIQSELNNRMKILQEKIEKYDKYLSILVGSGRPSESPEEPEIKLKRKKSIKSESISSITLPLDTSAIYDRKKTDSIIVNSHELLGLERDVFLSILLICNIHSVYCIPIRKIGSADEIEWDEIVQIGALNTPNAYKGVFKYLIESFDYFPELKPRYGRNKDDFRNAYKEVNQALFGLYEKDILFCYIVDYVASGSKRRFKKKCILLTPNCAKSLLNRDIPSLNFTKMPRYESNFSTLNEIYAKVTPENQKKIILKGDDPEDD